MSLMGGMRLTEMIKFYFLVRYLWNEFNKWNATNKIDKILCFNEIPLKCKERKILIGLHREGKKSNLSHGVLMEYYVWITTKL